MAADPIEPPNPEKFPEFRKRLEADEYQERLGKVSAALEQARKDAEGKMPVVGCEILSVSADSAAERFGMKPQDILIRLDRWSLCGADLPRTEEPQRLEYFLKSSNRIKIVTIQPGPIGVDLKPYWRPELAYLRGKSTDPKWDAEVFVGIVSAGSDPDLAETAWSHAVDNGYVPDGHAAASGIELALAQGRTGVANDFAHFVRRSGTDENEAVNPVLLFRAAAANYQLQEMLRLVQEHPQVADVPPIMLQLLIELHTRRSEEDRNVLPPHMAAATMQRDDLLQRLVDHRPDPESPDLQRLQDHQEIEIEAPPAHFHEEVFSPTEPTPNVDISFKFRWEPAAGDDGGFMKDLVVDLQDYNRPEDLPPDDDHRATLIGWAIAEHFAMLRFNAYNHDLSYVDRNYQSDATGEHEIRIIRIGGQAELFIDGNRVLYMPVDESVNFVRLTLRAIGCKAVIRDLKWDELIEKP